MSKIILGMAMSLDGFINDRNGDVSRIYANFENLRESDLIQEAIRTTGAVVMGRRSYDMGQGDFTGYEFQTPIFVLTHHVPEQTAKGENENLKFHFVIDGVESAITQAKTAAGDKNVTVIGGAETIQQLLNAGLFDELEITIAPILLGDGQRLFENLSSIPIELEQIEAKAYHGMTNLRFRAAR